MPRQLHKGVVVKRVLQKQAQRTGSVPDFVFVIGDDKSDEKMFSSVMSYAADADADQDADGVASAAETPDQRLFLCTVGRKSSLAGHYLDTPSEVESLLSALSNC